MQTYLADYLLGAHAALDDAGRLGTPLQQAADEIIDRLARGGTIYFVGNGGSASDAQHLAAELMGRFSFDRAPLRAICLNTDTSVITAVANDFGYEHAFERQVQALVRADDVLLLISTSGESPSVLAACRAARATGALTIGLTGPAESSLALGCDLPLPVGRHATCHIQEAHIVIGQALCGFIEQKIFS